MEVHSKMPKYPYRSLQPSLDRNFRNDLNQNFLDVENDFKELKSEFDNAVETVSTDAFNKVVNAAKIEWLPPVNTFGDLTTTYPDATEGKAAMARDSGKVYRMNDQGQWTEIQDIDPSLINEVDQRLDAKIDQKHQEVTAQLAETATNAHLAKNIGIEDANSNFTSTDVEGALEELFTNVSNGKIQVRDAIAGKGGTVADGDGDGVPTFQELSDGVGSISSGAAIKNVQRGLATLAPANTFVNVSISPVDASKSFVRILGQKSGYNALTSTMAKAALNSQGDTITFTRNQTDSSQVDISWEVIEFEEGVQIQKGLIDVSSNGSTTLYDSISSVDLSRCQLFYNYTTSRTDIPIGMWAGDFYNEVQVRFRRWTSASGNFKIEWVVVQYD